MQNNSQILYQKHNLKIQPQNCLSLIQSKDIQSQNSPIRKSISLKSQTIRLYPTEQNQLRSNDKNNAKNINKKRSSILSFNFQNKHKIINNQNYSQQKESRTKINKKPRTAYQNQRCSYQIQESYACVNDLLENCRKTKIKIGKNQENQKLKNLPTRKQKAQEIKGEAFNSEFQLFQNDHLRKNTINKKISYSLKQPNLFIRSSACTPRSPKTALNNTKTDFKPSRIKLINQYTQNTSPLSRFNPLSCKQIKSITNEQFYNFHLVSLILDKKNHKYISNENQEHKFLELIQKIKDKKNKNGKKMIQPIKRKKKFQRQSETQQKSLEKITSCLATKQLTYTKLINQSSLLQSAVLWSNQRLNIIKRKRYSPQKSIKNQQNIQKGKKKDEFKLQGWENNKDQGEDGLQNKKHNLILCNNKNFSCLFKISQIIDISLSVEPFHHYFWFEYCS